MKSKLPACQAVVAATLFLLTILGCATPKRLNDLSVGMSKSDVIHALGQPSTTSAVENTEILRYRFGPREQPGAGSSGEYFVRIVDGRVVSFGPMGEFGFLPRNLPTATRTVRSFHPTQMAATDSERRGAIRQLYLTLQQREPDWQGWSYWTSSSVPLDQVKKQMMAGVEYQTKQQIIQIFQTVMKRPPVAEELNAWYSKAARDDYDTEPVRTALQQPDQGRREAIRWLYKYLQQRDPDPQGWDYWTAYDATIPEIIPLMMSGIEFTTKQRIVQRFHQSQNRDPSETELNSEYTLMLQNREGKSSRFF